MYYYIKEAWKKPDTKILRQRMIEWRKTPAIVKVDKPLRLDRARNLWLQELGFCGAEEKNHAQEKQEEAKE